MENISKEENKIRVERVRAKYVAQTCPVCNGFGTLKYGAKICQGCGGKGYILIPTEKEDKL